MILLENDSASAAFYFASEEYIMRFLKPVEPALMLWRTDDTVMIGANQVAGAESDGAYARAAGITIVRRPSGGGAIFTDPGTLQYTVILPYHTEDEPKAFVKDWLARPVIRTLARYGAAASIEGRNDIVLGGKKISGVAQYIKDGYLCSHGSLLFATDMDKLSRALTPDPQKIQTKAITSVRSRVTNISDHIAEHDIVQFHETLIEEFSRDFAFLRRGFEMPELDMIEAIRKGRYENPDWTFGRAPAFTFKNKKRFPGGTLEVFLDIKSGLVQSAKIRGDFLALQPISAIEEALEGRLYREDAIRAALQTVNVRRLLGSLGEPELIETLF